MKSSRIILWLRNDLRMHDNYVFNKAMSVAGDKQILPVFCFDPRTYGQEAKTEFDTIKTGLVRSRFQIQAVKELRKSLQKIGSNLVVTKEKPEEFIPKLMAADANINNIIVYQQEICSEELTVDAALKKALEKAAKADAKLKSTIETVWGSTLHHIDDFTYNPYQKLAENYTGFMRNQNGV
jgi:deoxyribodipyrimidine photo-lyase